MGMSQHVYIADSSILINTNKRSIANLKNGICTPYFLKVSSRISIDGIPNQIGQFATPRTGHDNMIK